MSQLLTGLGIGAVYGILGLAFAITFGVLRVLNLAYGEVLMVGAMSAAAYAAGGNSWAGVLTAIVLGLVASVIAGLVVHGTAIRPLGEVTDPKSARHTTALVASIGAGLVLQNLARVYFGPYPRPFPVIAWGSALEVGEVTLPVAPLSLCILSVVLTASLWRMLHHTDVGLKLRAVAAQPRLAAAQGINPRRVELIGVALGSALAGVAGLSVGGLVGAVSPTMAATIGFKGLVVAIVAGLGRVRATLVVALALGLVEAFAGATPFSSYRDAVASTLVIVFLILRPEDSEPGRVG